MKILALLCIFLSGAALAATQSVEITDKIKRERTGKSETEYISKFAQWGDNEVLVRYTDTEGTRRHADVSLGFRYLMTNTPVPQGNKAEYAVAIAYQGEFDFFALTRNSSPVVTTRHNPSIFYTRIWDPEKTGLSSWFISLEHESNGQVTDTLERLQSELSAFALDYEGDEDVSESDIFEMAQQTISRSNNFAAFGANYQLGIGGHEDCSSRFNCISIFAKVRHQLDKEPEDQIWWRERVTAELKDYVGTEIDINAPFFIGDVDTAFRITYRTGQLIGESPFKRNTFDLRYYIDVPIGRGIASLFNLPELELFAVPMVVRYHNGYLDELYNYSQKVSYLALGLHARY
ncbi:MAG: hypothetical protein GYB58_12730 [Gammaproteobacteria bacterium]|nr:hypothetical protein [Gammaproteobacteria bacterium]